MLGKIVPYVIVGFLQAALILFAGVLLFGVPVLGSLVLLAALTTLFIATNLSFGYTFSTLAQNQLQAVQMSMMFFLPNMLLSGFLFPFAGMPAWARIVGEFLPLTHFLRIVRSIMLKGSTLIDLRFDTAGTCRPDALCHGDCGHPLPAHVGLARIPEKVDDACRMARRGAARSRPGGVGGATPGPLGLELGCR